MIFLAVAGIVLTIACVYELAVLPLTARPASADLATLPAMADTDEVVRLRLLRVMLDLEAVTPGGD